MTTRAIPSKNAHNDLRVIWSGDNKKIVADHRPQPPKPEQPTKKRVIVVGKKKK